MKLQVFLLAIVIFMGGCTKNVLSTKKPKLEPVIESYSEDLTVFLPKFESKNHQLPVDNKSTNGGFFPNEKENINDQNVEIDAILEKYKELNKKQLDGSGYRVQVYIGNNKQDFESAKTFLFRNFADHEVYESYSQPTYKIKMGDFLSFADAEILLDEIKARYSSARIVTEKINLKNAINSK